MAAVEPAHAVDTQRLSSFLDIDGPDIQTILDSAAEGVVVLLQQVEVKAREYEEISNAKELLEVKYGIWCLGKVILMSRTRGPYDEC